MWLLVLIYNVIYMNCCFQCIYKWNKMFKWCDVFGYVNDRIQKFIIIFIICIYFLRVTLYTKLISCLILSWRKCSTKCKEFKDYNGEFQIFTIWNMVMFAWNSHWFNFYDNINDIFYASEIGKYYLWKSMGIMGCNNP